MSISADRKISNFPFLTRNEFEDVCKACLPLFQQKPGMDMSTSAKFVKDSREEADNICEEMPCYLSILTQTDLHCAMKLGSNNSAEYDIDLASFPEDDLDEV